LVGARRERLRRRDVEAKRVRDPVDRVEEGRDGDRVEQRVVGDAGRPSCVGVVGVE